MERNQAIVIAVVVVALALFGLKVWSDRSAESDLIAASDSAAQRLARAGGSSGAPGSHGSTGGSGPDGSLRPGSGARGPGSGPGGRVAGAQGGSGLGGGLGSAIGGRPGAGPGGGAAVADGEGGLGPKVQQKQNLVDFLGSQPPTDPSLANTEVEGDDAALKLANAEDIPRQGGQDQDVQQAEEGEGIKITDQGKIEFPNYASGDEGTISFQIEPEWSGTDQSDNALVQIRGEHEWNNRLELVKNGEFLRFIITDNTGKEADISTRIAEWQMRGTHDVVATWANGELQLWVDGRLAGRNKYPGQLQFAPGTPMYVGGDHAGSNYAGANATFRGFEFSNNSRNLQ